MRAMTRREVGFVASMLAIFLGLSTLRALDHSYPFYDDVSYLDLGYQIHEAGGPLALLKGLFGGTYLEENRNPLYLAMLSLVAGRDFDYHRRAEALNIAIGAVMILAWWWVARRHLGQRAAMWFVGFLCLSETAIAYSSKEACEPLMMIFWALGVDAILNGAWLSAGAYAGLAFLTKGNGIFLLFCLGIAALAHLRLRAFRDGRLYGAVVSFCAASSPLLVRNFRAFGSPLHNWNSQLLWLDHLPDFSELFAPHALDKIPHTPAQYLAQLTVWGLIRRLGIGLGETLVHIGDAMSLVAPVPWGPVHIALLTVGLGCAVYAIVLIWRAPRGFPRTFLLVHAAWFYAFFVFYNVVSGSSRYVFPMTVTLAAVVCARLATDNGRWSRRALLLGAIAVLAAVTLDTSPRRPPDGFLEAESWVLAHIRPGEAVAVDSRSRLQPVWLLPPDTHQAVVSTTWDGKAISEADMLDWLRENHVRYVIIDGSSNLYGSPRWFFYERLRQEPDGSVPLSPLPPGLKLAYAGQERPRRWEILELERTEAERGSAGLR